MEKEWDKTKDNFFYFFYLSVPIWTKKYTLDEIRTWGLCVAHTKSLHSLALFNQCESNLLNKPFSIIYLYIIYLCSNILYSSLCSIYLYLFFYIPTGTSKRVRKSWQWRYIHIYLSLCTQSADPNLFSRHTLYITNLFFW